MRNSDGVAQASELLLSSRDPEQRRIRRQEPVEHTPVNRVGDTHAPLTHEWTAGVDADLPGNVSVTATLTHRKMVDLLWSPLIGVRAPQYAPAGTLTGTLPEGGSFSVPLFALRPAFVPAGGGLESLNRTGYHQRYVGFELGATKRLSNHWMAHARVLGEQLARVLRRSARRRSSIRRRRRRRQRCGRSRVRRSTAGRSCSSPMARGRAASSWWRRSISWRSTACSTLPFGFDMAGNLVTRQGYAEPFFRSNVDTGDPLGLKTVLLTPAVDAFRLPAVTLLNARLEKKFMFGSAKIAIDFDVFNALNSDTVLGRQYDARMTGCYRSVRCWRS